MTLIFLVLFASLHLIISKDSKDYIYPCYTKEINWMTGISQGVQKYIGKYPGQWSIVRYSCNLELPKSGGLARFNFKIRNQPQLRINPDPIKEQVFLKLETMRNESYPWTEDVLQVIEEAKPGTVKVGCLIEEIFEGFGVYSAHCKVNVEEEKAPEV